MLAHEEASTMQDGNADVIPLGSAPMMDNYLKLSRYVPAVSEEQPAAVASWVFPFNSGSTVSRLKALRDLSAAMHMPRPADAVQQTSVWRRMHGYDFPVIGEMEATEATEATEGSEEE